MTALKRPLVFSIIFLLFYACTKETFYTGTDASLRFSSDTISFDTIFTTIGSATRQLLVYNPYSKSLKINSISLAGGASSAYLINIDGMSATSVQNIDIRPKDSLYIFLQVYINPLGRTMPLRVSDSIRFELNSKVQYVNLEAIGQDVHLIRNKVLKTQDWTAGIPYLLYGDITVDTLQTLTIGEGTVIYFHRNANLNVKGSLIASGSYAAPVVFSADRLDTDYTDVPGQWGGIAFLPGCQNLKMNWVVIKNGTSGISLLNYSNGPLPSLEISNTIIRNMSYNCLLAVHAKIKAWNCVFSDAAHFTCGLMGGGDYSFYHCTIANYFGYPGRDYANRDFNTQALYLSDYYHDTSNYATLVIQPLTQAAFYNTLVYGSDTDEFQPDLRQPAQSTLFFDHCLIKSTDTAQFASNTTYRGMIWNRNPLFKNIKNFVYEPDSLSPVIDRGDTAIGLLYPLDLNNTDRTRDKGPDIGAYEWVPK